MGDKHKKYDPIKKMKEWQENQYNPGYYSGKIPPYIDIPPRTSLSGKLYKIGTKIVSVLEILAGAALIFMGAKIDTPRKASVTQHFHFSA